MRQYLHLLRDIIENGLDETDRTGVGARGVFGRQMRFDLGRGFPLLTTKKLHVASIFVELLWFLRGDTNVGWLRDQGVTIWDEWADADGELGPVYGRQWRAWPAADGQTIDQLSNIRDALIATPQSRRHVVSAWNPADLDRMALPPCHCLFQFHVAADRLDCHVYQRSADIFLGVPFNIASYALLTTLMARAVGLGPGDLVYSFGDVHLYATHVAQAERQLARAPRSLPTLELAPGKTDLFAWEYDDFSVIGYDPLPAIKATVAV